MREARQRGVSWCLVCLASLSICASASGQSVTLPERVTGQPGAWIVIVPKAKEGGAVKWHVGKGLTEVPIDKLFPDSKPAGVVVQGPVGTYEVWAWNALKDSASDLAVCQVVIGDPPPTPPVPPGPTPPGPTPPVPPGPTPGPVTHVLVVYETADVSKLPPAQQQILYSKTVRDLLDKVTPMGPDGKTHNWRIYDKDIDASAEVAAWQDLLKRPRQSVPWVIFAGEKGVSHEGPLPASVAEMQSLIQKFAPSVVTPRYEQYRKAG